jgi:glycosyltransferase involved in cell wall biosynthesis
MISGALCDGSALWLDVTRTLTRIGRGAPTGIDRVERAYLRTFLAAGCDRYLCRTTRGFLLLDRRGGQRLLDLADGSHPLGRADLLSRVAFRGDRPRHRAEGELRRLAIDRALRGGLKRMVARQTKGGLTYFNVGHSNLSEGVLSVFRDVGSCAVMVHDLIPITHPKLVADELPEAFAGRIDRVRRHASHVIANSTATAEALAAHWNGADGKPEVQVAPLGIRKFDPVDVTRDPKHFVMLGTIEARKNHALMVETWEALAEEIPPEDMPKLHILGHVGWKVDDLLARLEEHPLRGRVIHVHGAVPDAEVDAHLAKARALLFPSIAEGYGFPPLEAALAGAIPVCSDLAVFHETIGDCAVYVNNPTAYQWKETIKKLIDGSGCEPDLTKVRRPTWQEHFEIVAEAVIAKTARGRT